MRKIAQELFLKALDKNHPQKLIQKQCFLQGNHLMIQGQEIEINDPGQIYIKGVGKAARYMVLALRELVSVDECHVLYITQNEPEEAFGMQGSHPAPNKKSREAARQLISFIDKIPPEATVLFALSGGASALVCEPAENLELDDVNRVHKLLLESGAAIDEMNAVRKHLSKIKGGQLLRYLDPECTLIDLVISDVPGDDLEIIGSGPTTTDSSTYQDAYDILLRYDLWETCPDSVKAHIEKGLLGEAPETLKKGEDPLRTHHSFIIGSAAHFAESVGKEAQRQGFPTWIAPEAYDASVDEVAQRVADKINEQDSKKEGKRALIFYGESTVKVTGSGKGGRNQELALRGALNIAGKKGISWLSAGTDGIDGPTDAAGATVDGQTIAKAEQKGLEAVKFLVNNDSYHFHEQMGTLFKTGATGTNVMDITIVLVTG